ncbi:MAG: AmmeMemoRadiSam system protein A, partial [Candidatus Delongbacteria bacterium]|nr:AmmeMemoRadiSam system protein A [Candidatus Delongbacteria bacterium]
MEESVRKLLLILARESINSRLNNIDVRETIKKESMPEEALKEGACFVTLTKNNDLRGCIGSLEAYRSLYDDIVSNSINSAFKDTRFTMINKAEMKDIKIEISILSERSEVQYENFSDLKKKIIPDVHGVYLSFSYHSATFLPQVWEQLNTHEQFFTHLCRKAGL